ncbi:uncharacterized protein LOC122853827 [Aphidius gifuensis]|uniref:uncharacterized protein LOC122853827 n=1 Tax=Aphidius gifuensis TaxID=684658 RepID=UPI001CDC5357|nr:uncharacterized protein LOC122853827 [Aphidius gifuensis]
MYKCPSCLKVTWASDNSKELLEHTKHSHKSGVRSGHCPIDECEKPFGDIYKYISHVNKFHQITTLVDTQQQKRPQSPISDQVHKRICINLQTPSIDTADLINNEQPIPSSIRLESAFDIQLLEFKNTLHDKAGDVVKDLYADVSLSMKVVQQIIKIFSAYQKIAIEELKKIEPKLLSDSRIDTASNFLKTSFLNINTQSKAFKYLDVKNALIKPVPKLIEKRSKPIKNKKNRKTTWLPSKSYIQTIPMKLVLKKFLEIPNVLNTITDSLEKSKISYPVSSFVQGEAWRNIISQYQNKFVIPLSIYFDDFEINNPLGSHKKKIEAVYYTIACLPHEFCGKIENWFVAQFHKEADYSRLGNKRIFENFISELLELQNRGISLVINGVQRQVYFHVGRVLGDNLGLNQILGFVKGFTAIHYCRICISSKTENRTITGVEQCILRNQENYDEDVERTKSTKKHSRGVWERSVFEPVFDMFNSPSVDPLHDLQEGTSKRWILKILDTFLVDRDLEFELKNLNDNIKMLNVDTSSGMNIPSEITDEWIIKKKRLRLTGSEMGFLIEYLGILIGSYIPRGNKIWEIYILYRKIYFLIMAPSFSEDTPDKLDILIKKFYKAIRDTNFGSIIPKDHFLLHYPRAMKYLGPLRYASTIRGEAVHRDRKRTANTAISRVNLFYTLALRFQLKLAKKFVDNQPMMNLVTHKVKKKIFMENIVEFRNLENISPVEGEKQISDKVSNSKIIEASKDFNFDEENEDNKIDENSKIFDDTLINVEEEENSAKKVIEKNNITSINDDDSLVNHYLNTIDTIA